MNITHQNTTLNSSSGSQIDNDDAETIKVRNYVKDLLKSRIFLGRYVERRLITTQIGYRDIVVLSAAEVELKRDLLEVQYKINVLNPNIYVGVTDTNVLGCSPAGALCICTEIDNQPFGVFWFQIKTIKFRQDEVMLSLKCVRHITESFIELEPILTGGIKKTMENKNRTEIANVTINETFTEFKDTLKSALSISNVKEFFTFLFAFIIAIFTGSTAFVNFLGNFILALIREMSFFVQNSTPMFLGILDFFSKIVGGFYILLAMIFKQNAPPPTNSRTLTYYNRGTPKQNVYYDDKQFD